MNASLPPIKDRPPSNTVGVVMSITGDLKRFKFVFHSVLSFTDYPYMLTIVEAMQPLSTRTYLRAIRRNHPINVIENNEAVSADDQINLALKYTFTHPAVRFGCVIGEGVIVEPEWLSPIVARLMSNEAADKKLVMVEVGSPCGGGGPGVTVFRRSAFEECMGYDGEFRNRVLHAGFGAETAPGMIVHKINGGRK